MKWNEEKIITIEATKLEEDAYAKGISIVVYSYGGWYSSFTHPKPSNIKIKGHVHACFAEGDLTNDRGRKYDK